MRAPPKYISPSQKEFESQTHTDLLVDNSQVSARDIQHLGDEQVSPMEETEA